MSRARSAAATERLPPPPAGGAAPPAEAPACCCVAGGASAAAAAAGGGLATASVEMVVRGEGLRLPGVGDLQKASRAWIVAADAAAACWS